MKASSRETCRLDGTPTLEVGVLWRSVGSLLGGAPDVVARPRWAVPCIKVAPGVRSSPRSPRPTLKWMPVSGSSVVSRDVSPDCGSAEGRPSEGTAVGGRRPPRGWSLGNAPARSRTVRRCRCGSVRTAEPGVAGRPCSCRLRSVTAGDPGVVFASATLPAAWTRSHIARGTKSRPKADGSGASAFLVDLRPRCVPVQPSRLVRRVRHRSDSRTVRARHSRVELPCGFPARRTTRVGPGRLVPCTRLDAPARHSFRRAPKKLGQRGDTPDPQVDRRGSWNSGPGVGQTCARPLAPAFQAGSRSATCRFSASASKVRTTR